MLFAYNFVMNENNPSAQTDGATPSPASKQFGFHKAVQAIHISPNKGNLTLVMRKVYNVLLKFSGDKWKDIPIVDRARFIEEMKSKTEVTSGMHVSPAFTFTCKGSEVLKAIGTARNHAPMLYESLKNLRACEVNWNMMRDGGEETFVGGLLSEVSIIRGGTISWTYGVRLFELLVNPKLYQRIDLALQQELRSYAALALYENSYRYIQVGSTGWRPVTQWRALLSVSGHLTYESYTDWKRFVLNPAMRELEYAPLCDINLELEEKRGDSNKIEFIKFNVAKKVKLPLFETTPLGFDQSMVNALRSFDFKKSEIDAMMAKHEPSLIDSNLQYLNKQIAKGEKIRNKKGYLIKAIHENYAQQSSKPKKATPEQTQFRVQDGERRADSLRDSFQTFQMEQLKTKFFAQPESKQREQFDAFLQSKQEMSAGALAVLNEKGFDVLEPKNMNERSAAGSFWVWRREQRPALLTASIETDILVFALMQDSERKAALTSST